MDPGQSPWRSLYGRRRPEFARSAFECVEAVAADRQLVAVAQLAPLDQIGVDEDAVEAAVVEDAQRLARFGDDQGVAAGDAGVIEADIGGDAAADPRPAALDLEVEDLAFPVSADQVAAAGRETSPQLVQPACRRPLGRDLEFGGGLAVLLPRFEDRVEFEARGTAAWAVGKLIVLLQGKLQAALDAEIGARTRKRPALVAVGGWSGFQTGSDDGSFSCSS